MGYYCAPSKLKGMIHAGAPQRLRRVRSIFVPAMSPDMVGQSAFPVGSGDPTGTEIYIKWRFFYEKQ